MRFYIEKKKNINKVQLHIYKARKFIEKRINRVPFEEVSVKSPYGFLCFGLLKRSLGQATYVHWNAAQKMWEKIDIMVLKQLHYHRKFRPEFRPMF